jgi:hypothetical protein
VKIKSIVQQDVLGRMGHHLKFWAAVPMDMIDLNLVSGLSPDSGTDAQHSQKAHSA